MKLMKLPPNFGAKKCTHDYTQHRKVAQIGSMCSAEPLKICNTFIERKQMAAYTIIVLAAREIEMQSLR